MKPIKVLPLILLLLLSSGCIFVPVPQPSEQGDKIDSLLDQLVEGKTTRKEVILIMGEPDESSENSIVYWHREYSGGYKGYYSYLKKPFKNGPGSFGDGVIESQSSYMDLFFEFDSHGILTRYSAGNDNVRDIYGFPKPVQSASNRAMETKARCFSGCDKGYHACINSDDGGNILESQCEEEKLLCTKSCENVKRLKRNGMDLCLKWETSRYVPCNHLVK